jgi:D-3-phosphoglycerate dehydrogenase
MKSKVMVTAFSHPYLKQELERAGYEVVEAFDIKYPELIKEISGFTGLIVTTRLKIDQSLLDQSKSLKWIGRLGSGMEMIDVKYAESMGIKCVSSPEGNRDAVAEHTLGMMLSLLHNICIANNQVKEGIWLRDDNRGTELGGKTVGIIGFGNTGGRVADLLGSFGVKVLAYDAFKKGFGGGHVVESNLKDVFDFSDIISLHLPLTTDTFHFADDAFFKKLKRVPLFLNMCRGKVMDTSALIRALEDGAIMGAGLDVLENEDFTTYSASEKEQFQLLANKNKVMITPHIAGYSHEALLKMAKVVLLKLGIV